jgi:phosphoribosylaminoimidazolecarboxamide formyltransferase/IMP cyclohydrolase
MKKPAALISVYDKQNLVQIAPDLVKLGYDIIASSGTSRKLNNMGIKTIPAETATRNPDVLRDCIPTIGYPISAGILFDRSNLQHQQRMTKFNLQPIDLVICNFPPVTEVVKRPNDFNIHHVDVGGPLMIRSAATNYRWVLPIVDPHDYQTVCQQLKRDTFDQTLRKKYAQKAFQYCADYDTAVVQLLQSWS